MNRRVKGDLENPTRKWGWQERDQDFQVAQSCTKYLSNSAS